MAEPEPSNLDLEAPSDAPRSVGGAPAARRPAFFDASWLVNWRRTGLVAVLLGGIVFFAAFTSQFYSIDKWLFWRFACYWLTILIWATSCLALGHALLARVFGATLRKSEQLVLGLALGVLAFGLGIFFLGLVHGLNVVTFFALPVAFLAIGGRGLWKDSQRIVRHLKSRPRPSLTALTIVGLAFGVVALGLLYIQILWPQVFSFDTRWYHMPIAQRYALSGAVSRFEEGYWNQAWPHLMSYIMAWAFLAPRTLLFDRIELCAHMEFVLFLCTLAQIPVLVRRLVPGAKVGLTWLVMLAFPGMYLYDSNLHVDADHAAAFFAIPIALAMFRAWRSYTWINLTLFALLAGAAALVKYTALSIVVTSALALFVRGLWLSVRRTPGALSAVGALMAVSLVITAPHWLKNIIWFGDPIYPMLHDVLGGGPWTPEVPSRLKILHGTSRPAPLNAEGIQAALSAMLTFSFLPNNWPEMHRNLPVFGSLFTLTLPSLLFIRPKPRLVALYALAMCAVFVWYIISHFDRYLQAILPWMASATAASLILIWRSGELARVGALGLLAIQIIWGSDVPFFRTHNLIGDSPIRHVASFIPSGFERNKGRLRLYEPLPTIGEATPKDAVVLAHDMITILGIDRNWVSDDHQCRLSYGRLQSPRAIHDEFRALGVTHLVWFERSIHRDTLAGDLAFLNYAARYAANRRVVAGHNVAELPQKPPADARKDYDVALFGCGRPYRTGWYKLTDLMLPVIEPGPPPKPRRRLSANDEGIEKADYLVIDEGCTKTVKPPATFKAASVRDRSRLYVRAEAVAP